MQIINPTELVFTPIFEDDFDPAGRCSELENIGFHVTDVKVIAMTKSQKGIRYELEETCKYCGESNTWTDFQKGTF